MMAYYQAASLDDQHLLSHNCETFDECVEMIRHSEEKAVSQGYKPEEWLIVIVENHNEYFQKESYLKGCFKSSVTSRRAIAIYNKYGEVIEFDPETL